MVQLATTARHFRFRRLSPPDRAAPDDRSANCQEHRGQSAREEAPQPHLPDLRLEHRDRVWRIFGGRTYAPLGRPHEARIPKRTFSAYVRTTTCATSSAHSSSMATSDRRHSYAAESRNTSNSGRPQDQRSSPEVPPRAVRLDFVEHGDNTPRSTFDAAEFLAASDAKELHRDASRARRRAAASRCCLAGRDLPVPSRHPLLPRRHVTLQVSALVV